MHLVLLLLFCFLAFVFGLAYALVTICMFYYDYFKDRASVDEWFEMLLVWFFIMPTPLVVWIILMLALFASPEATIRDVLEVFRLAGAYAGEAGVLVGVILSVIWIKFDPETAKRIAN